MWIPPEDVDPILLHEPTRKSVAVFGAVRPADGCLLTQRSESFNAGTFLSFLQRLVRHRRRGQRMVVVVDNARWHHARLLNPWLKEHRKTIQLDFLPPYSPELNSIERVWKLTRRICTHNRYFATMEELVEIVFNQFDYWYKPNKILHRLCAIT
jgi:transposase